MRIPAEQRSIDLHQMQLSEPRAKIMVALLRSTSAGRLQRRGRGKEGVASRSLRSEGGARRRERRHEVARGAERDDVETGEGRGEKLDETEYFRGLVTSPFKEEDRERDLITPTVKFVGRAGIVLFVLFLMFMKSNGLL